MTAPAGRATGYFPGTSARSSSSARWFLYWLGARPTLCIAYLNIVKQVLFVPNGLYPKNFGNSNVARLLGQGLVLIDSDDWKRHRKVIHLAFNMDKIKGFERSNEMSDAQAIYLHSALTSFSSNAFVDIFRDAENTMIIWLTRVR